MGSSEKPICPLLKEACIESRCKFWVHLYGKNPQTEQMIDNFDCAVAWLPVLLVENAQTNRQTGAAVESFRNEVVKTVSGFQRLATLNKLAELEHELKTGGGT